MDAWIVAFWAEARAWGRVFTVRTPPGDNASLHHALSGQRLSSPRHPEERHGACQAVNDLSPSPEAGAAIGSIQQAAANAPAQEIGVK